MDDFLDQVETAANMAQLYYLTLAGTLVIPDMCGALESADGEATGAKYIAWVDTWVVPAYWDGFLTGADCYRFRCSFLHQGRTQHPMGSYRLMFLEPGVRPAATWLPTAMVTSRILSRSMFDSSAWKWSPAHVDGSRR